MSEDNKKVAADHPFYKIQEDYDVVANGEVIDWLRELIPNIQLIGNYKADSTPLDMFDSECHTKGTGIATPASKEQIDEEDEIIFLINVAEHVKRPKDMFMFLGEYFKFNIIETTTIHNNNLNEAGRGGKRKQDNFFVTSDILNYLGTASKLYIEQLRQELRISIALFRNPTFHDNEIQRKALEKNIRDTQILIIKRCVQVYKFIDYFHDKRKEVPLKYLTSQPPPYILNALFLKMKADYLRHIYECLSGDNSLLADDKFTDFNFKDDVDKRKVDTLESNDQMEFVESEIYYSIYPSDG